MKYLNHKIRIGIGILFAIIVQTLNAFGYVEKFVWLSGMHIFFAFSNRISSIFGSYYLDQTIAIISFPVFYGWIAYLVTHEHKTVRTTGIIILLLFLSLNVSVILHFT